MSNEAFKKALEMYETLDRRVFESRADERLFFFNKGMERAAEITLQGKCGANMDDACCDRVHDNALNSAADDIRKEIKP